MSKIIKLSNAKPITCACCGCVYEFESGDIVTVETMNYTYSGKQIVARKLECPNCLYLNDIVFGSEDTE